MTGHLERVLTWLPREHWFDPSLLAMALNHQGNAEALARLVELGAPISGFTTYSGHKTTLLHKARGRILEALCRVVPSLQIPRDFQGVNEKHSHSCFNSSLRAATMRPNDPLTRRAAASKS